jgi:type II secretory pathway component GspD/PulD (secretin)
VVLGGVYEQNNQQNVRRIPFFGELPYVGSLFKNTSAQRNKDELLIFVTPRILADSNKVILTIIPSNRFLSGKNATAVVSGFERFDLLANGATQRIDLPRISQQVVVTKLMLESGQSAILGGLVIESTTFEDKKVPLLGDIPVVGYLFKQRNDLVIKENLLVFITPRIARGGRGAADALDRMLKEREGKAPERK